MQNSSLLAFNTSSTAIVGNFRNDFPAQSNFSPQEKLPTLVLNDPNQQKKQTVMARQGKNAVMPQ